MTTPKVTYNGNMFNRRKLTSQQVHKIAQSAIDRCNKAMYPKGGTINLGYDWQTDSWIGQYIRPCAVHGAHQIGLSVQGRTAWDAVCALEEANLPHCDVVQEAFDQQSNN